MILVYKTNIGLDQHPSTVDDEAPHKVVEQQLTSSSRGLSAQLGPHFSTIDHHLHQLGFSNRHPRVIPHELSPEQCQCRLDICRKFIAGPKDDRLWKGIVTGDEKWVFFNNPYKGNQWLMPGQQSQSVVKGERFGKKVMLCVWWNYEGLLHFELSTLTSISNNYNSSMKFYRLDIPLLSTGSEFCCYMTTLLCILLRKRKIK